MKVANHIHKLKVGNDEYLIVIKKPNLFEKIIQFIKELLDE